MRRFLLLLILLPAPLLGANWDDTCDAQLVTLGLCETADIGNAGTIFGYFAETAQAVRLRDALGARWQATLQCTQEMVDAGDCDIGDLGEDVPNPESKRSFADRRLRWLIRNAVRQYERSVDEDAIVFDPFKIDGAEDN
jgi:hypothetical protein